MFTKNLSSFAFAATLTSIALGLTSTASAGNYNRVDRLAVRIQKNAQRLLEETTQYRRVSDYRHLAQETCLLRDTATHIHDVTHFEGNLRQLKRDVAMIDQTTHHLQDLIQHIDNEVAHRHGHAKVNTRRAKNLLRQIERDVHSLSDELAEIGRAAYKPQPQTYYKATPKPVKQFNPYGNNYNPYQSNRGYGVRNTSPYSANRPSYDRTALGFSIGGGSSRIWIGF